MHAQDLPKILKIDQFVSAQLGYIADRLAQVPEGGGTMYDGALITYVNACGGHHHYGQGSYAVVTLGTAGGALKAGQYQRFDRARWLSDAYVTIANALGMPITTFGDPMHCNGPVPGLV
jgi:hypothetical protein